MKQLMSGTNLLIQANKLNNNPSRNFCLKLISSAEILGLALQEVNESIPLKGLQTLLKMDSSW